MSRSKCKLTYVVRSEVLVDIFFGRITAVETISMFESPYFSRIKNRQHQSQLCLLVQYLNVQVQSLRPNFQEYRCLRPHPS
mmetsp:Transcript_68251/g.108305  ORF Transcript_68251/g.108305 Transcript_68251/m.108305 type:complete len:81 (+) Transcript_68251:156-398(+)